MEKNFWHERWESGRLGFHQKALNPWLAQYWRELTVAKDAQVLVPLCGKSGDMIWLRDQGHKVVGIELSDIACRDFFIEQGIQTMPITQDGYHHRQYEGVRLLCSDIFDLPWSVFQSIGAVYDRAALIALPCQMRKRYAQLLALRLSPGVEVLLVSLEFQGDGGPPFAVFESEVRRLFEPAFTVQRLDAAEMENPRHPGEREVVYHLTRQ